MGILETIMLYYGAFCGLLAAAAPIIHVLKLDETKGGKLFLSISNDILGLYKTMRGAVPPPPPPAEEKK